MTRGDLGIVGAIVALLVGSLLLAATPAMSTTDAVLQGPAGVTRVSLETDADYVVQGEMGPVTFSVVHGVLRCVDSSCPDHLCVQSGALAPGRPIVCAPNKVIARLATTGRGDLDAVSR